MRQTSLRLFGLLMFPLIIATLFSGCQRTVSIKEIKENPRKYVDKTVRVRGEVVQRMGLLISFYEIDDGSDKIRVVSSKQLPEIGKQIQVTGKVKYFAFGNLELLVIIEGEDDAPAR